ncbi:Hypothetical predicted protein [Octopus vulgaris]|uniref:Uncharacterized protein n=1 Tax=Octopus vulgaris TaxID=6645 RepID=A0AA36F7Q4_OCTVU|nr:Hypothetical predicted protein [Octopus vulgaris]
MNTNDTSHIRQVGSKMGEGDAIIRNSYMWNVFSTSCFSTHNTPQLLEQIKSSTVKIKLTKRKIFNETESVLEIRQKYKQQNSDLEKQIAKERSI